MPMHIRVQCYTRMHNCTHVPNVACMHVCLCAIGTKCQLASCLLLLLWRTNRFSPHATRRCYSLLALFAALIIGRNVATATATATINFMDVIISRTGFVSLAFAKLFINFYDYLYSYSYINTHTHASSKLYADEQTNQLLMPSVWLNNYDDDICTSTSISLYTVLIMKCDLCSLIIVRMFTFVLHTTIYIHIKFELFFLSSLLASALIISVYKLYKSSAKHDCENHSYDTISN